MWLVSCVLRNILYTEIALFLCFKEYIIYRDSTVLMLDDDDDDDDDDDCFYTALFSALEQTHCART